MSQFLLMRYFNNYGKAPFDVIVDSPQSCLLLRQFGYVCFKVNTFKEAQELIAFVSVNKNEISCTYPVLFRILWEKGKGDIKCPSNCSIEKRLDESDILFRIKS